MAYRSRHAALSEVLPPLTVGVMMLAVWELACRALTVPSYLFPTPSAIAQSFIVDVPGLMRALWSTLRVALVALGLATLIGSLIAFLFVQNKLIERCFFPYAVILQVTPIVAIAPLIIILVKNTQIALIICATIIAIFPIIGSPPQPARCRGEKRNSAWHRASR